MSKLKKILLPVLLLVYATILSWQINQPPFERFPQWDNFWGNMLQAGKLLALRISLLSGEMPVLNPFVGFGWNNWGDTTVPQHLLLPANLLVLFMSPEKVISLRMIIMLAVGSLGTILYLKSFIDNKKLLVYSGLLFITIPFTISFNYYYPLLDMFLMVPLVLWSIHRYYADGSKINRFLFVLMSLLAIAAGDVFAFITVIPVIGVYSFIIGVKYYKFSAKQAIKSSLGLSAMACLAGAFYIVPLYWNLKEIGAFKQLLGASIQPIVAGTSLFQFLYFFAKYCLLSVILPIEGSGTLLYTPPFFYVACVYLLRNHPQDKRSPVVLGLLYCAGLMFLIGVAFYMFPAISKTGNGILRYQTNLLPFAVTLAGILSIYAIYAAGNKKELRNILLIPLAVDLLLYFFPVIFRGGLWHINHGFRGLTSSNYIPVRIFDDLWKMLPFVNLTLLLTIIFFCRPGVYKNKWWIFVTALIFLFPIYNLSFHNELRANQQAPWQQVTRSSYRYQEHLRRRQCLTKLIGTDNLNYRILPCGKKYDDKDHGRNFKFIAATELAIQDGNKMLFGYKETMHPYTGLLYSTFWNRFIFSNIAPPLSQSVPGNLDFLKLMGVGWVISADEEISNNNLEFQGECFSGKPLLPNSDSVNSDEWSEAGYLAVYKLKNPQRVVFWVDNYVLMSHAEIIKNIFIKKDAPWTHNTVLLERLPPDYPTNQTERFMEQAPVIVSETFNTARIELVANTNKFVVWSNLYRPFWHAYIDGKPASILRAYGGFMAVQITPGKHTILFKYVPYDVFLGLFLTAMALILALLLPATNPDLGAANTRVSSPAP